MKQQQHPLARWTACWFLALGVLSEISTAHAQGTAFTYQGRLNNGASPANGSYDLTFSLFDSDTNGIQVGVTLTNTAVGASNGLFVVTLDFGAGMFDGTPRWLEIGVHTNGGGSFASLSPRQALTPTPYAIYAANATSAASVAAGSVAPGQLSTPAPPADGQVLAFTGGSLQWTDPAVAGGSVWSTNGSSAYYSAGNVGIGTAGPATALEVNGVARSTRIGVAPQYIELNGGDSGSIKLTAQSTVAAEKNLFIQNLSGEATPGPYNNMQFVLGTTASPSIRMTLTKDGNVILPLGGSGGGITIGTPAGETGMSMVGGNRADVRFDGSNLKLLASGGVGIPSAANGIAVNISGNVGLGSTSPQAKLHMYDPAGSISHRIETGGGVNAWTRMELANGNGQWNLGTSRGFNGDQLYFQRQATGTIAFAIQPNGDAYVTRNLSTCSLTVRGGCDLAEPFPMKEDKIEKGSVVVIDKEHPGQLKLSACAYDARVAGIVSGANGINPGIALHQEGALEGGQNVALTGRVYVKADAAFGAIEAGDILTTSDTPGHAMKVTDHAKAQGAILGKAMSALKEGRGMVLVLVTLQ